MPTSPFLSARAPIQTGATKNGAVRTISVLPPHLNYVNSYLIEDRKTARLQDCTTSCGMRGDDGLAVKESCNHAIVQSCSPLFTFAFLLLPFLQIIFLNSSADLICLIIRASKILQCV
jgi:hypothetical protein